MLDFSKLEKGFYPVKEDDAWDIMYFDGDDFYNTCSGQYDSCEHIRWITEIGERIKLPDEVNHDN